MKLNLVTFAFSALTLSAVSLTALNPAFADESVKEQTKEAGRDAKRGMKKTVREVKDKTCEMVNGKMECAAQKVKHSVQNGAEKVEDAVE